MADIINDPCHGHGKLVVGETTIYYKDGEFHREDGPAYESSNGYKLWYYHGKKINCTTQEQFVKIINMRAFW